MKKESIENISQENMATLVMFSQKIKPDVYEAFEFLELLDSRNSKVIDGVSMILGKKSSRFIREKLVKPVLSHPIPSKRKVAWRICLEHFSEYMLKDKIMVALTSIQPLLRHNDAAQFVKRFGSGVDAHTIIGLLVSNKGHAKHEADTLMKAACSKKIDCKTICNLSKSKIWSIQSAATTLLGYCSEK